MLFNSQIASQYYKQIERCSEKISKRGRVNDDKQLYRNILLSGVVESPECPNEIQSRERSIGTFSLNKKPFSICSSFLRNTNIPTTTIRRLIIRAKKKRVILSKHEKEITWCILRDRVKYKTIQYELYETIIDWILKHPHVKNYPISRDIILVLNPKTNRKEKIRNFCSRYQSES